MRPPRIDPLGSILLEAQYRGTVSGMDTRDHIARLYPQLRAYATRLVRDRAEAEDFAGDAVVRALSRDDVPQDPERLRGWLLRTIRNLHIDRWRAARVRREYREAAGRSSSEGRAIAVEDDVLGRIALAKLPAHHREVLILVDGLGHSYAEAGDMIGVPRGTVMSRLARARAAMVAQVRGDEDEG